MSSSSGVDTQSVTHPLMVLSLSLEDRNTVRDMIAKSRMVDDPMMRQAFCNDLGINTGSMRITELPPEHFGGTLVDLILSGQMIKSWDLLGDKLRGVLGGSQLELLNQIFERAKQRPTNQTQGSEPSSQLPPLKSNLIPLERIPDISIRKIEKRLREMNPTKTDVNLLVTWYFNGQLAEMNELFQQIDGLTDELRHGPRGSQLSIRTRKVFRKLFALCTEIQNILEQELQGIMLDNRHIFGLNTRNSLKDVKDYAHDVLKALDSSPSGIRSADFNEAIIGIQETFPKMILKMTEIDRYLQKVSVEMNRFTSPS